MIHKFEILARTGKEIFGAVDDIIFFTMKFHMLYHTAEDLERFDDVGYLDASPFEPFNYSIKSYLKMTSLRKGSTFEESL